MNSITAKIDKSDYEIYGNFLNIEIDGYWLDERLGDRYPNSDYKGLIPTLLFAMELEQEAAVVWERILPDNNSSAICPILMCPDDCDFSCTLIVTEIEAKDEMIKWNRLGVDQTTEFNPPKVGSTVEWLEKMETLTFRRAEYESMLDEFSVQYRIDEEKWKTLNGK